jgi:hypothetical protein
MWWGETGEDRIALEQDMGRRVNLGRNNLPRRGVRLMPGREQRHYEARIDRDHRRVRSTDSAIESNPTSGGPSVPGCVSAGRSDDPGDA